MTESTQLQQSILLVDDEANILRALDRILKEDGYQVFTALSGEEGLKLLEKYPIQLVISDQRMPVMSGSEFLTIVNKKYPLTVRMLLTGYSDFEATKEAINSGSIYKFISKPWDENLLRKYVRDAFKICNDRDKNEKMLMHLMNYDKLTGLHNRVLFSQSISRAIAEAQLAKKKFAIASIDIDRFSSVSGSEGEETGDQILQLMAGRLKDYINNEDHIARFGGDEFILILENINPSDLDNLLTDLSNKLHQPLTISGKKIHITTSIGASIYPDNGDRYDLLIKCANKALLYSKKLGGSNYQIYSSELIKSAAIDFVSESELHQALESKEFIVYYQPIIEIDSGKIKGAEALLRWQHPVHGLLAPDKFITLCEESGIIVNLGAWVLRAACEQMQLWRSQGHPELSIAVNFSARQFNHPGLFDMVSKTLVETGIPADHLEFEITESIMIFNMETNLTLLNKLRSLGMQISLDDFGTGYSSLSYLKQLPITVMKIDKSFINEVAVNRNSAEIVTAIIAMAKSLNLSIIAEGVEKQEQLDFLREKSCDYFQGYLFSKPVPAEEFSKLLRG